MLILIDESGCSGFKLDKGSTAHFVLGMVIFNDIEEAEKVSKRINQLKSDLKIWPEFKFSKTHPDVKDAFFQAICSYDFSVRALTVNKQNIRNSDLRTGKEPFYHFITL